MLAPGAPILWIVGFVGMGTLYWAEKILIVYVYRKDFVSPSINDKGDDLLPMSLLLFSF